MSSYTRKILGSLTFMLMLSITACKTIGLEIVRAIQDHSQEVAESGGNNACHKASDFICEIEQEIHLLVNNHRKLNGKHQLKPHNGFSYTSRQWSNELAYRRVLSHDGFPSNRYEVYQREFKDKNVSFTRENVAYSSCNAKKTSSEIALKFFSLWSKSAGHNANMLANDIKIFGAGIYHKENKYYATLILGNEIKSTR